MIKVGFIGAGNMGSALAKAAVKSADTKVYLYDMYEDKAKTLADEIGAEFKSNEYIAEMCDYIFLAVKPNIIKAAAEEISKTVAKRKNFAVVSMAAGVSIDAIEKAFSNSEIPIIRIMPNTPVGVGKGMTLWCKNGNVTDEVAAGFEKIMEHSGRVDAISEKLIDAASAVSGCGPAFVYMFIEALADGGVECGLPRDKALLYACETLIGAAETVKASGKHPEELKDAVCSPGGSTIAGVHALEEGSFRASSANAVRAAYQKTLTLGK
jgi:pyrroline-5-carboxylate reductase